MERQENINSISGYNHGISLLERKNLVITGVKRLDNFDKEQFLLDTVMGYMIIKGEDLELVKLDTLQGNVTIKGTIGSISYVDENKKSKDGSILNKLFK